MRYPWPGAGSSGRIHCATVSTPHQVIPVTPHSNADAPIPGVRNNPRIAMQALGARCRSSHRSKEHASIAPNPTRSHLGKPPGRKNRLRQIRKKSHPKNTSQHPVFNQPSSSGFQLGDDKKSLYSAQKTTIPPQQPTRHLTHGMPLAS